MAIITRAKLQSDIRSTHSILVALCKQTLQDMAAACDYIHWLCRFFSPNISLSSAVHGDWLSLQHIPSRQELCSQQAAASVVC